MKQSSRNTQIDHIRGISMVAMILIHASYFYISQPLVYHLWNLSQFAVPAFVFCSAYLFFTKPDSYQNFLSYFTKRITRLLKPYYIFLLFFIPLIFLTNKLPSPLQYITDSVLLQGGVDINWLVLLFMYFVLIFPFVLVLKKNIPVFTFVFILSGISTVFFIWNISPVNYRYIMWLPWSFLIFITYFFATRKDIKFIWGSFFVLLVTFLGLMLYKLANQDSLSFINNKYPPNLYYLSYGVVVIYLLYGLSKLQLFSLINTPIHFFSKHSYSLYFIHYFVLTFLIQYKSLFTWYTLFIAVTIISVALQLLLNILLQRVKPISSMLK